MWWGVRCMNQLNQLRCRRMRILIWWMDNHSTSLWHLIYSCGWFNTTSNMNGRKRSWGDGRVEMRTVADLDWVYYLHISSMNENCIHEWRHVSSHFTWRWNRTSHLIYLSRHLNELSALASEAAWFDTHIGHKFPELNRIGALASRTQYLFKSTTCDGMLGRLFLWWANLHASVTSNPV